MRIDEGVIAGIEAAIPFAPAQPGAPHRHPCRLKVFPALADKNVAVFDTAFHQTPPGGSLPLRAALQALSRERHPSLRRPRYLPPLHRRRDRQALGKPLHELNIINCHLGNGASVCAIKNGESVDTSMGLTLLEGLAMGTQLR